VTIVWRDALSVGNDLIDADHRHLLSLINTLELVLTTEQPFRDLQEAVAQLRAYTQDHFSREERIMIALRYATYDAHKHAHAELIEDLDRAIKCIVDPDEAVPESTTNLPDEVRDNLITLLRTWLVEHIVKKDLLLKPLLADRPRNFSP
jgi:hemerythrin